MLQIICVKVGDKFKSEWVNHLYNGVRKNISIPFEFTCLTDDPRGINHCVRCITPIRDDLQGWWQKVTLFSKELPVSGNRMLYLDLDIVLTGDITPIVLHPASFATLADRWQGGCNSSFMLWNRDEYHYIYDEFEGPGDWIGDQNYITSKLDDPFLINDVWPEWVKSFKIDLKHREPISDERLIFFHGLPRPWDLEWVRNVWNRSKQS